MGIDFECGKRAERRALELVRRSARQLDVMAGFHAIILGNWKPTEETLVQDERAASGAQPMIGATVPRGLAGLVSRITCYTADEPSGTGDREVASFTVPVIFSFADPFRIAFDRRPMANDRIGSFVSGLHPGYVDIAYGGPISCLQIDLTPLGARLFFRRPMTEFATRLVPLEDVEDRGLNALCASLGDAATQSERLRIAVAFLEHRLLGQAIDPKAAFVWSAIQNSQGTVRIDRMIEDLGWSRKRLVAQARDAFGMTPKRLARVARFQHATHLAKIAPRPDWAGIAAACGYSDQAHLVRDFNAFAGEPPERWSFRTGLQAAKQNDNTGEGAPG